MREDLYVVLHGVLPNHYLTQAEAKKAGWDKLLGNLAEVLPGRVIGGDVFENRKHKLPESPGRIWYEADFDYDGVIEITAVFFTLMMVCCLLHTTIICHFAKLDWRALYEYNYS